MTSPPIRAPGGVYEGAGRQVAVAVRGCSAIVVASDDPRSAAHVALGIGLAESAHRIVMIADLAGEIGPLQTLITDDDSHGVFDSFEFGTSFGKLAREVVGASNLFIMPSGTESAATEQIIGSPRWKHIAAEFAESDEMLILVASAVAPGIARLVGNVDGVVLVGPQRLALSPDSRILARVPHPVVVPPPRLSRAPQRKSQDFSRIGLAAIGLLAAGIAGGALFGGRDEESTTRENERPRAVVADSAAADSAATVRVTQVLPVNPHDSAGATAYSVEILNANTAEGANFELERHRAAMPAATISQVPIGDTEVTWYKVYAGAYDDSLRAEALLRLLRRRRIVPDSEGQVVRAPLALLVDSVPSQGGAAAKAREMVQGYVARGLPVYALLQRDGGARLYAGAFNSPEQASLAATALRVAGVTPVLAYRTGRIP